MTFALRQNVFWSTFYFYSLQRIFAEPGFNGSDNQTTFFHSEREDVASKLKKTALTYAKCSVLIDNSSMNGTLTPHAIHAKTEMK